ncbi:MAG: winged helix DNA-binding protein [Nitrososphaerales archaeon]|nr:winged helix DNA-binding protein [Nitrososphaerales archaeon]
MADPVEVAAVAFAGFFVVLAVVLLAKYKQASEQIQASSDLGRDLWKALEDKQRKQDERILDLMGRVEVMQSRLSSSVTSAQVMQQRQEPVQHAIQERPQSEPSRERRPRKPASDASEKVILGLLRDGPKSTIEIKQAMGLSREHTARLMKSLYDAGLVERDESAKPFVYRLTDKGRGRLE